MAADTFVDCGGIIAVSLNDPAAQRCGPLTTGRLGGLLVERAGAAALDLGLTAGSLWAGVAMGCSSGGCRWLQLSRRTHQQCQCAGSVSSSTRQHCCHPEPSLRRFCQRRHQCCLFGRVQLQPRCAARAAVAVVAVVSVRGVLHGGHGPCCSCCSEVALRQWVIDSVVQKHPRGRNFLAALRGSTTCA